MQFALVLHGSTGHIAAPPGLQCGAERGGVGRRQLTITTPIETLEWCQYEFIAEHPVGAWATPTRILRGAQDDLVPPGSIETFCERTGAILTVAPDSGHYFHTDTDLAQLHTWLDQAVPINARALDQAGE